MVNDFETSKSHRSGKSNRSPLIMEGIWKHFCRNGCNIRLHKLIILVIVLLVLLPVLTHYYLSKVSDDAIVDAYHSRSKLEALDDVTYLKAADLKMRIEELLRIKASVNNELRELEYKRQKLQNDISAQNQRLEELKSLYTKKESDLEKANLSLEQAKLAQQEVIENRNPALAPPRRILPSLDAQLLPPPALSHSCTLPFCFEYSRCSLTSGFPVYVYPSNYTLTHGISEPVLTAIFQAIGYNPHITQNPDIACLYMVIVGPEAVTKDLTQLRYWRGDGRNHLLFAPLGVEQVRFRAFVASANFSSNMVHRPNFDLIIPPLLGPPGGDTWQYLVSVTPAFRPYLLTFMGSYNLSLASEISQEELKLQSILTDLAASNKEQFYFDFSCGEHSSLEYALCGTPQSRSGLLRQSTFVLILSPPNPVVQSTPTFQTRIFEAIANGAVPVLVGQPNALPFADVLHWEKAVVILPRPRLPELHYMLRSVPDRDILALRLQGRFYWEKYMGSVQAVLDATLSLYRQRLGIPPLPVSEEPALSVFNDTFTLLKTEILTPDPENEESLGPIEPPFPSPSFGRNLSNVWLQGQALWNQYGTPHLLYPYTPWDTVPPSEAKFVGSQYGFRPINGGVGGSGKEFSMALGGNLPREQFTIIILTYEREAVLLQSLTRLKGLPYLHKVLVVWNSPKPPASDLRWPDIGVPIQVIRTSRNSLNNRFLPYESIETEAVLSVDDDAHLKHDEIVFSFRVWRENRDRIVGFPGRYHAWDLENRAWLYNSNYSCELSMVLTGAAFFHKYYAYLYTYVMPQAIRDKVDEFMNCEDIAMNFLVSHVTRLPPVKVTSRWTFRCPGCPVSLSEDDTHFQERHKCINFFTKVYGYMPLLHTQYRVDSVLFKTRIPHDKQKCFKYI